MTLDPIKPAACEHDYRFRLFVTGSTARSTRAIENMLRICEEHLHGRYDYEVVDVYQNPTATRDLQIIATPTLVKLSPEPVRRIVGDLSNTQRVLFGLDIAAPPALALTAT